MHLEVAEAKMIVERETVQERQAREHCAHLGVHERVWQGFHEAKAYAHRVAFVFHRARAAITLAMFTGRQP
jgi:hypothetical protein